MKRQPDPDWPACGDCPVKGTCEPVPPGKLFSPCDIALIGEAPGKLEHAKGHPFIGPSGKLLKGVLHDAGYDTGRCLFDNACRMPHNKKLSIARHCVANTLARISEVKPKMIVALGGIALDALCRKKGGITMWEGVIVQPPRDGRPPVAALQHPAVCIYSPGLISYWSDLAGNLRKLRYRPRVDYTRIRSRQEFCTRARGLGGVVAFDYETTGLDPFREELRSVAFADENGAFAAPADVVDPAVMCETLLREDLKLVAQNAHFEAVWSRKCFGVWPRFHRDTRITAHLIDENAPKKLSSMTRRWLPEMAGYDQAVLEYVKTTKRADAKVYADIPLDELLEYNAGDALATFLLECKFDREDISRGLERMLLDASMVFAKVQWGGFRVDLGAAEKVSGELEVEYERIVARVRSHRAVRQWEEDTSKVFNVRSPKQVAALLHDKRYLRDAVGAELVPTKTGLPSTSKKALRGIGHPLVKLIQLGREVSQRNSTFVRSLPGHAVDGFVHPVFSVASTVTGQGTCTSPNVMNQKKHPAVRGIFRPSRPDGLIVTADYEQSQLGLLAMFSHDRRLAGIYRAGQDAHRATAVDIFGTDDLTKEQRDEGKTVNYSILFGTGTGNLAGLLGTGKDRAQELIDQWFTTNRGAAVFRDILYAKANETGIIESVWKQLRRLPAVWSSNYGLVQAALRQAFNFPISNADRLLTFWSMIRVDARLRDEEMGRVAANMHDSISVDLFDKRDLRRCCRALHDVMVRQSYEELDWMTFPLRIDVSWGRDWACPHKVDLKKILKKQVSHGVIECGG